VDFSIWRLFTGHAPVECFAHVRKNAGPFQPQRYLVALRASHRFPQREMRGSLNSMASRLARMELQRQDSVRAALPVWSR